VLRPTIVYRQSLRSGPAAPARKWSACANFFAPPERDKWLAVRGPVNLLRLSPAMPARQSDSRPVPSRLFFARPVRWLAIRVAGAAGRVCDGARAARAGDRGARHRADAPRSANLQVFDAAWSLVNRKFYDPKFRGVDWPAAAVTYGPKALVAANDEQLYGVINTMLAGLKESHNWASLPGQSAEDRELPRARLGFCARPPGKSLGRDGRAAGRSGGGGGRATRAGFSSPATASRSGWTPISSCRRARP
jgi:hypothetical protein